MPRLLLIEPEKELEPTPVKEATPAEVRLPVAEYALNLSIPTSKSFDIEAVPVMKVLAEVGARVRSPLGEMVRLESPPMVVALIVGASKLIEEDAPVSVMFSL